MGNTAIPTYASALVAMVLLVFTGGWTQKETLAVFGQDVIWLMLAAFVITSGMEKSGFAKRLALWIVSKFGTTANKALIALGVVNLLLAFIVPSTTARAAMLLPICMMVLKVYKSEAGKSNFGKNMMIQEIIFNNVSTEGILTATSGQIMTVGRAGHALGSTWYVFDFDGKRVLYTGDMVAQSATLATDLPEHCEAAIMNGAYAGKQLSQSQQYEKLLGTIKETYAQGGSVMLPIPPKGRGIDIMLFLDERLEDARIFVEKAVVTSMNALAQKKAWLKDGLRTTLSDKITVISSDEEREAALKAPQGIYITGDGMITTDVSMVYYEALKSSENNAILITGHAATGTIGAGVLDDTFRKEHGVNAKADKIIFKVHLDDNDIYDLTTHIQAKKIVLFHADTIHNTNITHRLAEDDVLVTTLAYPSKLEM